MDGILYPSAAGHCLCVILTAEFRTPSTPGESPSLSTFRPDHSSSPFYYEYIWDRAKLTSKGADRSTFQFQLPLSAFLFRYDRGAFWMARPIAFSWKLALKSPMLIPLFVITSNNPICRFLFRSLFTTRRLYRLLNMAHPKVIARKMVIMDVRHSTL